MQRRDYRGYLGFDYGVLQAPLGPDLSGPELVAAVSNAGSLGFLRAPDKDSEKNMRKLIQKTRLLTKRHFGVGIIPNFPHEENLKVILEEKVYVLQVWGGCSSKLVARAHFAGVKVIFQVGTIEGAKHAMDCGVDAIIVQGYEAGGHQLGHERLSSLVPKVVNLVRGRNIPIIAAGGIVDAEGYIYALSLGATGVSMGTRFLATKECFAHPTYKKNILKYNATEYTDIFGRKRWRVPHRVLRTPFYEKWKDLPYEVTEDDQPIIGHTKIYDEEIDIRRFAGTAPNATTTGDVESMVMYAGEGVGRIKEIISAREVIMEAVQGARLVFPEP